VNDVRANPNRVIGLETARHVFHIEHGQDFCSEQNITDVVSDYIDGKFQSGVAELLYSACVDGKTYVVVSQVDGASWCAVTGIFPCYSTGANGLAVLKAGKISEDQISRPMMLFSNGALINPNVIPQLSHFAPVWIKKEIQTEDIYLCSPDAEFIKSNPQLQPSMRLRERDVEKCIEAQTNLKIANLPITKGEFRVRRHQKIRLEHFSDWCQHLTVAKGIKLLALL
jgi:hypothetical protein